MPVTLTVRDETATGQAMHSIELEFLTERITVRELIRSRVYQEVKDHNVRAAQSAAARSSGSSEPPTQVGAQPFRGLVTPTDTERELNTAARREPRQIDWKKQFDVATSAFERNGFLILVDDRQAESLDEEIEIRPATNVSFVKLVPLVGG